MQRSHHVCAYVYVCMYVCIYVYVRIKYEIVTETEMRSGDEAKAENIIEGICTEIVYLMMESIFFRHSP